MENYSGHWKIAIFREGLREHEDVQVRIQVQNGYQTVLFRTQEASVSYALFCKKGV